MSPAPPYKKFERQIERIHQLLEAEDAIVTWNERISDPDSPEQPRQIDVTVRRDGSLTLIECRLHKEPQDVTWIEELMGRRLSLRADAVIAVSASGFTSTARRKAAAHGIHLRDFLTLSDVEIQNWGRTRTLTLTFCEFTQVVLAIQVSSLPSQEPPQLTDIDGQPLNPMVFRLIFQAMMQKLPQGDWPGHAFVDAEMQPKVLVNGNPPSSMSLHAAVRRISQAVQVTSVYGYVDPAASTSSVEIGHYALGDSEIIENQDDLAMTIDLSAVTVPDNCCFENLTVDAGRIVNVSPRLIGFEHLVNCEIPFQIRYGFPKN